MAIDSLAQAITNAVENQSMREQAAILSEKISSENGIKKVVEILTSRNSVIGNG